MTALDLLDEAHAKGIVLQAAGDRLKYEAPAGAMTPELRAALVAHKHDLLALLAAASAQASRPEVAWAGLRSVIPPDACALCGDETRMAYSDAPLCRACASSPASIASLEYRAALRRCWRLMAQGSDADAQDCRAVIGDLERLTDDVGPERADTLRHRWAREYHARTGLCPTCGNAGTYHDPDGPESP